MHVEIEIEIEGAGAFDQPCVPYPANAGTMNSIDLTFVENVHVVASAENSNLWALAITSIERVDG